MLVFTHTYINAANNFLANVNNFVYLNIIRNTNGWICLMLLWIFNVFYIRRIKI